jgi:hypothetical protein
MGANKITAGKGQGLLGGITRSKNNIREFSKRGEALMSPLVFEFQKFP